MGLVAQGEKIVTTIAGARVINNNGRTVVIEYPNRRYLYEKEFVGEKVTTIPKVLANWTKIKRQF